MELFNPDESWDVVRDVDSAPGSPQERQPH
jgi:hypothetical protein